MRNIFNEIVPQSAAEKGSSAFSLKPLRNPIIKSIEQNRDTVIQSILDRGVKNLKYCPLNEDVYTVRKENLFDDTIQMLSTLYQPDDFVFAGSTYDKKVYPAGQLVQYFLDVKSHALRWDEETLEKELRKIDETLPFIIPNPVCGKKVMSKTGKESYRCDNAISEFKIMMCEFDHMSKGDQWAFWHGIGFPIYALIDSGGKSIHAWVNVERTSKHGIPL